MVVCVVVIPFQRLKGRMIFFLLDFNAFYPGNTTINIMPALADAAGLSMFLWKTSVRSY